MRETVSLPLPIIPTHRRFPFALAGNFVCVWSLWFDDYCPINWIFAHKLLQKSSTINCDLDHQLMIIFYERLQGNFDYIYTSSCLVLLNFKKKNLKNINLLTFPSTRCSPSAVPCSQCPRRRRPWANLKVISEWNMIVSLKLNWGR